MFIPQNTKVTNFRDIEEFFKEDLSYFRLQGRLGNQLLGLSDAHLVHKLTGLRVVIDTYEITKGNEKPEWFQVFQQVDWAIFLNSPIENMSEINATILNLGNTAASSEVIKHKNFFGFKPSLKYIEESGLFSKGDISTLELRRFDKSEYDVAICVRRGDYVDNPHLGLLSPKYYKDALKALGLSPKFLSVEIFTDDVAGTTDFIKDNFDFDFQINPERSPLNALAEMSSHSRIILANSTFSFWGNFFSAAESVFPSPFYLSQPKWHSELISPKDKIVECVRFPRMRYFVNLAKNKLF